MWAQIFAAITSLFRVVTVTSGAAEKGAQILDTWANIGLENAKLNEDESRHNREQRALELAKKARAAAKSKVEEVKAA